ncbi:MAG: hypothetical protein MUF04_10640, partial [Akkermansiaceae bacterium]|nr:hypothetical protein [Akkermansiaceae bacterium]
AASNGRFTATLLKVWTNGAFTGALQALLNKIRSAINGQTPNYLRIGSVNTDFENRQAFKP